MDAETIQIGNLSPEILESIFSRIPLKPRTRLKCVSKSWCNYINDFRYRYPPTTNSGIVLLPYPINSTNKYFEISTVLIKIQGKISDYPCVTDLSPIKHTVPVYLIDSCIGLILYGRTNGNFWMYYICSPLLGQIFPLPQAHEDSRPACVNLVFDGLTNHEFRVIGFFLKEIDCVSCTGNCINFSSDTWEWRVHKARILNSHLLLEKGFRPEECIHSSVYSRGKFYLIWSTCFLIYDDKCEFFKVFPLPLSEQSRQHFSALLWVSEEKIYFGDPLAHEIAIFKFVGDEFLDANHGNPIFWQFIKSLRLQEPRDFRVLGFKKKLGFKPLAFDNDLQVLYLLLPVGTIFAYDFETEELEEVWSCEGEDVSLMVRNTLPFEFNPVDLSGCFGKKSGRSRKRKQRFVHTNGCIS